MWKLVAFSKFLQDEEEEAKRKADLERQAELVLREREMNRREGILLEDETEVKEGLELAKRGLVLAKRETGLAAEAMRLVEKLPSKVGESVVRSNSGGVLGVASYRLPVSGASGDSSAGASGNASGFGNASASWLGSAPPRGLSVSSAEAGGAGTSLASLGNRYDTVQLSRGSNTEMTFQYIKDQAYKKANTDQIEQLILNEKLHEKIDKAQAKLQAFLQKSLPQELLVINEGIDGSTDVTNWNRDMKRVPGVGSIIKHGMKTSMKSGIGIKMYIMLVNTF
jgi:hypothetical protein